MTVYVDKKGNFKKVLPDDGWAMQDLQDRLSECNIFLYSDRGFYSFIDGDSNRLADFCSELEKLPFTLQVELDNLLLKAWSPKNSNNYKRDYFKEYQYFIDEYATDDDDSANIQKEFFDCLKYGDESVDSPLSDFKALRNAGWNLMYQFLNLLESNLPDFKWWRISGCTQGELTYAWTFDVNTETFKELTNDLKYQQHFGDTESWGKDYTIEDALQTAIYNSFVCVQDCDEKGTSTMEQIADKDVVANLFLCEDDEYDPFVSDPSIDEYMEEHYQMYPAKAIVTYTK